MKKRSNPLGKLPVTDKIANNYPEMSRHQPVAGFLSEVDDEGALAWPVIPLDMLIESADPLGISDEAFFGMVDSIAMPFNRSHVLREVNTGNLIKGFIDSSSPPNSLPLPMFHAGYLPNRVARMEGRSRRLELASGAFVVSSLAAIVGEVRGVKRDFTTRPYLVGACLAGNAAVLDHDLVIHYANRGDSSFSVRNRAYYRALYQFVLGEKTKVTDTPSPELCHAKDELDLNKVNFQPRRN